MFKVNYLLLALVLVFTVTVPALAGAEHHRTAFDSMSKNYLAIQAALAADSMDGVKENALAIAGTAQALTQKFEAAAAGVDEKDAEACSQLIPTVTASAAALAEAPDIKAARDSFGELSEALVVYRNLVPGQDKPSVAYCGMAKHNWLQNGKTVNNPYYGSKMLRCGSIVSK
jgi:hypothetical protein